MLKYFELARFYIAYLMMVCAVSLLVRGVPEPSHREYESGMLLEYVTRAGPENYETFARIQLADSSLIEVHEDLLADRIPPGFRAEIIWDVKDYSRDRQIRIIHNY